MLAALYVICSRWASADSACFWLQLGRHLRDTLPKIDIASIQKLVLLAYGAGEECYYQISRKIWLMCLKIVLPICAMAIMPA